MYSEIEDFKTGWYEISICLREEEIDILVGQLEKLKSDKDKHFHISSIFEGSTGVGDIEFSLQAEDEDNMYLSGFPIRPNR